MIGAIIGDIVGSRFEFNNLKETSFDLFTPECDYTDDTICTIAVADAILNKKGYQASMLEWCRKYPEPMGGYGGSFAKWIFSSNPEPYNSYGNGSAMRVSPIGWLYGRDNIITGAIASARITHSHPEGIQGAIVIAMCVYMARSNYSKEKISSFVTDFYGNLKMPDMFSNPFDETCFNAVPVAVSCFLESNSFEETIRNSILVGGDSDTIAAIAGSIAEPFFGIPDWIKECAMTYLPEDMKKIIKQFDNEKE